MKSIRSLAITFFGVGSTRLLIFLVSVVSARLLGHEEFGRFSYIYISVLTFSTFALMGQSQLVNFIVSKSMRDDALDFSGINFIIKATVILAIISTAFLLSYFYSVDVLALEWGDAFLALLIAVLIILLVISGLIEGAQYGLKKSHLVYVHMLWVFPLSVLVLIAGAKEFGLHGVLIALVFFRILTVSLGVYALGAGFIKNVLSPSASVENPRDFFIKKMAPVFASSLLVGPIIWVASSYVARRVSQAEFGGFNVAYQLYLAIIFFPAALSPVFLPKLMAIVSYSDFKRSLTNLALGNFAIALTLAALAYFSKYYLLILFGERFLEASSLYFDFMLIAAVFFCLNIGFSNIFTWHERFWAGAMVNMVWAASFIVLVFKFTSSIDAYALCVGFIGAYAIMFIVQIIFMRHYEAGFVLK